MSLQPQLLPHNPQILENEVFTELTAQRAAILEPSKLNSAGELPCGRLLPPARFAGPSIDLEIASPFVTGRDREDMCVTSPTCFRGCMRGGGAPCISLERR